MRAHSLCGDTHTHRHRHIYSLVRYCRLSVTAHAPRTRLGSAYSDDQRTPVPPVRPKIRTDRTGRTFHPGRRARAVQFGRNHFDAMRCKTHARDSAESLKCVRPSADLSGYCIARDQTQTIGHTDTHTYTDVVAHERRIRQGEASPETGTGDCLLLIYKYNIPIRTLVCPKLTCVTGAA